MNIKFVTLDVGERFEFCGQTFIKTNQNLAEDGEAISHLFMDETEVVPIAESSDEEKPPERYLAPSYSESNNSG